MNVGRHTLDARRLMCPLPVIKTQNLVEGLQSGEVVEVLCTDPGTRNDIPAWCRINGHEVLDIVEGERELTITLRVGTEDR